MLPTTVGWTSKSSLRRRALAVSQAAFAAASDPAAMAITRKVLAHAGLVVMRLAVNQHETAEKGAAIPA